MGIYSTTNNNPGRPSLLVVDGNSLASRAYFVNPYEFVNMIRTVANECSATHMVICFDNDEPNPRHTLYPKYKANRKEDTGRENYINKLRACVKKSRIACVESAEGDDAVASVAMKAEYLKYNVYILSGDGDFAVYAGLVNVISYGGRFKDRKILTSDDVVAKYGVRPLLLEDYKGLVGESSDGIPGVKGIGPKTAVALLQTYGILERIYDNLESIDFKVSKKLRDGKEMAFLSRQLATMNESVIDELPECSYSPDMFSDLVKEMKLCL